MGAPGDTWVRPCPPQSQLRWGCSGAGTVGFCAPPRMASPQPFQATPSPAWFLSQRNLLWSDTRLLPLPFGSCISVVTLFQVQERKIEGRRPRTAGGLRCLLCRAPSAHPQEAGGQSDRQKLPPASWTIEAEQWQVKAAAGYNGRMKMWDNINQLLLLGICWLLTHRGTRSNE